MQVHIKTSGQTITAQMPEAPIVGDELQITLPGAQAAPVTVKGRRWLVSQGGHVELELDCT